MYVCVIASKYAMCVHFDVESKKGIDVWKRIFSIFHRRHCSQYDVISFITCDYDIYIYKHIYAISFSLYSLTHSLTFVTSKILLPLNAVKCSYLQYKNCSSLWTFAPFFPYSHTNIILKYLKNTSYNTFLISLYRFLFAGILCANRIVQHPPRYITKKKTDIKTKTKEK